MLARCLNPKCKEFPRYGGRGITVWPEWLAPQSFFAYLATLGPCPPGMSFDRIDNDRGYEPGNVRWATAGEQARNRGGQRRNRLVTIEGQVMCLADAATVSGLPIKTIHNRLNRGLSDEEACAAFDYRRYNHF
jgi:hypothetical protein